MADPVAPLTNSEMGDWDRCKRRWYLRYYRQLRRQRDHHDYFDVGNLVHTALEEYYDPEKGGNPQMSMLNRAKAMIAADPENADSIYKNAELSSIMLEGYLEWLEESGADTDLEITGAEVTLAAELPNGRTIQGKLDARGVQRSTGLKVFVDHKTVDSLKELPEKAQTNRQLKTYFLLEFLNGGPRTDAAMLNMLRKVKRTARATPPFYERHTVRFNVQEIRNHWLHVVEIARQMDLARDRLRRGESHQSVCPPSPESCCGSWNAPFRMVCSLMDDGSDYEGMLENEFEVFDPLERYDGEEKA